MKKTQYLIFLLVFICKLSFSQIKVSQQEFPNSFCVARNSAHTYLYTDSTDDWLIQKSAQLLQQDIESVTGNKPILIHELELAMNNVIIIGSSSKSTTIQNLAKANKINISQIQNKWEAYQIAII